MKSNAKKLESLKTARMEAEVLILPIKNRDLLFFGLGLYLGEGSKVNQQTSLINSDPRVIRLIILWLKELFDLTDEHIRISLHLYPDLNEVKCIEYWSKFTGIPKSQFQKSQIDIRTNKSPRKHRKLPYGTARLNVKCNGNPKFGLNLFRKIMSSIEVVFENFGIIIQPH